MQEQQRLEDENRQAEIRAMQEQQRLQEEQRQTEIRARQEQQRLEDENRIDAEKSKIRVYAKDSPVLKGIMNGGKLSFWVEDLPSYASNDVRRHVDAAISSLDGKWFNGVKLSNTNSRGYADFTINWVKDYQERYIGRQVGDHLLVGLGSSQCKNDWKPFDGVTVFNILYHEVGHAMGQDHSKNYNNIMYSPTGNKYEYDYKETITLSDGYWKQIYFCNTGKIYFSTEKAYGSSASYKVFVLGNDNTPQNVVNVIGNFYPDCSGYKTTWNSFSSPCNVQKGSSLVLYNPSKFGTGADATIKIKFENRNDYKDMKYNFESSSRYYTQEYLDYVKKLFR